MIARTRARRLTRLVLVAWVGFAPCLPVTGAARAADATPQAEEPPDPDQASASREPEAATSKESPEHLELDQARRRLNQNLGESLAEHRFCSDQDYQVPFDEQHLCDLAASAKARCPGIEKACGNPFQIRDDHFSFSLDWLRLPELAGALRLLFWALIVLLVAGVAFVIVRRLVTTRAEESGPDAEPIGTDEPSETPERPVETDFERLLALGRQAAARGDFSEAMHHAYSALLRQLDQRGLIEMHRSKTNGDYRRSLASSAIEPEFSQVVLSVERVQFGHQPATEAMWHSVLGRVVRLVSQSQATTLLLLIGLTALGCAAERGEHTRSALGCGETPGGYSVLCELLSSEGSRVRRRIRKLDEIDEGVDTLIVLDDASLSDEEWATAAAFAEQGHTLLLAKVPSPLATRLQISHADHPCHSAPKLESSLDEYYGSETELEAPRGRALKVDAPQSWTIAGCDAGPVMAGVRHGAGTVLVLPNSRLLTNISMACRDNAWLTTRLLTEPEQGIEIVGEWTGAGSASPLQALERAHLTPWLLQLLALGLLLAWWKGPHFGLPRDPASVSRHAFVEHIRALGFLYAKSKASRHSLANYGTWALARLHERLLPGSRASMTELARALAELTGREETAVLQILIAAKSAHDEAHDTLTPEEHLNTMRELASLLKAAGGTR